MKYIKNIDEYQSLHSAKSGRWAIAKPIEASGLLKLEIRVRGAIACLAGKATAVSFINVDRERFGCSGCDYTGDYTAVVDHVINANHGEVVKKDISNSNELPIIN